MRDARIPNPALILIGASVLMSLALGMRQCLGLFLPPMTHDLGLTASDYTIAIAAQNIAWGVSQAPLGAVADKRGLRPVMLFGAALYVVAMVIMAFAGGVPMLALSGVLMGVSIACTGSSLAMTATARAVSPARRSMLLGVVARIFLDRNSGDRAAPAIHARTLGLAYRGGPVHCARVGDAAGRLHGGRGRLDAATSRKARRHGHGRSGRPRVAQPRFVVSAAPISFAACS